MRQAASRRVSQPARWRTGRSSDIGRITEAEIGDEVPVRRHVENRRHRRRIEDRDPAQADAFRTGGEPERVHRDHDGIVGPFPPSCAGRARGPASGWGSAKARDLHRRLVETSEFELGVSGLPLGRLAGERLGVGPPRNWRGRPSAGRHPRRETKRHGSLRPTDGARQAVAISLSTSPSGRGIAPERGGRRGAMSAGRGARRAGAGENEGACKLTDRAERRGVVARFVRGPQRARRRCNEALS